jgi:hypothetical protein
MKWRKYRILFAATCVLAASFSVSRAATISLGSSSDTYIRDQTSHTATGVAQALDLRLTFVGYIQFDMSALNIDNISSASLHLWKVAGGRNDTWTTARHATYGLSDIAGNTLQNWHETLDFDPADATNGLDFRNAGLEWGTTHTNGVDRSRLTSLDPEDGGVAVTETFNSTTGEITITGADLATFLNSRADANGLVTFVLPMEAATQGWGIATRQNANTAIQPRLDLEFSVVPEPNSIALLACAIGSAVLRRR